jgi:hypothetical protein
VPIDRNSLPKDPEILQQMLVDLTTQLDKTQRLLSQLLSAKNGTHSEQLSADQLRLFTSEPTKAAISKRTTAHLPHVASRRRSKAKVYLFMA